MSKILHGGRLASVREDVAKFTSSRKDDERLAKLSLTLTKPMSSCLWSKKLFSGKTEQKFSKPSKN